MTRNRNDEQDHALVRQCLEGSENAWKEFYCRFVGLIRSVITKRSWFQAEDVEDLTQTTFLNLTTALGHYDFEQSLARYVCVIAERVAIDQYRKTSAAKREAETETTEVLEEMAAMGLTQGNPNPHDHQLETAQLVQKLREALAGLDPKCRQLVELRYLQELSFAEIGEKTHTTENTATVQTRRCLDKLRTKLRGTHEKEPGTR
ncbi:MAG: sigma-70 family RNA polymerase sigma factor [Thermodesulfobacteriota bacterium]